MSQPIASGSTAERTNRRTLVFHDLDEVARDVAALHTDGYERAGHWDLAQVTGHLAEWMRFPIEGFPRPPAPVRLALWLMKVTVAPRQLRKNLASNSMPERVPTLRETVPAPGGDEASAVDRLRQMIERFKSHQGDYRPSPMFGDIDRETATRLQLIHCAHHLSFLVPKRSLTANREEER